MRCNLPAGRTSKLHGDGGIHFTTFAGVIAAELGYI
jgi:hypothetical protein